MIAVFHVSGLIDSAELRQTVEPADREVSVEIGCIADIRSAAGAGIMVAHSQHIRHLAVKNTYGAFRIDPLCYGIVIGDIAFVQYKRNVVRRFIIYYPLRLCVKDGRVAGGVMLCIGQQNNGEFLARQHPQMDGCLVGSSVGRGFINEAVRSIIIRVGSIDERAVGVELKLAVCRRSNHAGR